jgi:Eco29kI restriction endonuclease
MPEPYNPLDKINLGKSVVEALLEQEASPLSELRAFEGAGIYAIYYHGEFEAHKSISTDPTTFEAVPIYVGKAIPTGSRRGASLSISTKGRALWNRLSDHRDSIAAVDNGIGSIQIKEFFVRYLTVDDVWIPLGETLLISTSNPLWNRVIDGFGNHDPGAGRYNGLRPIWDVLHPGRVWAYKCKERTQSVEDIEKLVANHFSTY